MADEVPDAITLRAKARVGSVLRGKWHLDALLGIGGMASVYAATHRNGLRGAVKLLHAELAFDAEGRSRFLREGYVANKVDHPGAVKVLDDDIAEDGSVFLVMELLEGTSVEAARQTKPGGRFDMQEAVRIVDALLEVLEAAHQQGIIHRDLKPDNLFLTRTGQVKVLDFGIARLREGAENTHRTRTGTSMGTPAFMPPEQALGNWDQVDPRTDLWAAGATLWNLLTNRMVHEANTVNKLLLAAMTSRVVPIRTVRSDVPEWLAAVIDRALAFDAADRWQSASEFRRALREGPGDLSAVTAQPIAAFAPPTAAVEPQTVPLITPVSVPAFTPQAVSPAAPIALISAPPQMAAVLAGSAQTASPVSSDREPPTLRRSKTQSRRLWIAIGIGALCAVGVVVAAVLSFGGDRGAAALSPLSSSSTAATPTAQPDASGEGAATAPGANLAAQPPTTASGKSPATKIPDHRIPPKPTVATPTTAKTGDPLGKY